VHARALGNMLLIALLPACGAVDSLKARRTAREGNAFYAAQDYKAAIAKYHDAIALDPNTPNVYLNLGYSLFNIYRPESADQVEKTAAAEASVAFEKHLTQQPDDTKAQTFRIKTLLRAAPTDPVLADKAQELFISMLERRPNDEEARQYLVSLLIDTKRYSQAVEYFSKNEDAATMKILAIIADRSDKIDEAIKWYRRRAELANDQKEKAELYYELGTYLWNVLHYRTDQSPGYDGIRFADLGIEATKRAMTLRADYAEAHVYTNLLYLERAAREPSDYGKEVDQRIAFEFRTKAAKLMANKPKDPQ
jgi:tetratricopeptide (TPR) repeat protein